MEQIVRICKLCPDGRAQVACVRESACSGDCHHCSGCGAVQQTILLEAENPIHAQPGDLVILKSRSAPVLKAAAVLYLLPLGAFFGGYAIAAALDISGAVWGSLAFLASLAFIVIYDRRQAKNSKSVYTITGFAAENMPQSQKRGS